MKVHSGRMLNSLHGLMKSVIWTSPVKDLHLEQVQENRIIDASPIYLLKPFYSSDHVCPEPIIKEEVWVYIPPPSVVNNHLVIWFPCLPNTMEGILGDLQFSISVSFKRK